MGVKLMTGATGEQNIQAADDRFWRSVNLTGNQTHAVESVDNSGFGAVSI